MNKFLYHAITLLLIVFSFYPSQQVFSFENPSNTLIEICDNNLDDDGDGLIDGFDDDCICIVTTPTNLIPNGDFEEANGSCFTITDNSCLEDWVLLSGSPDFFQENFIDPITWQLIGSAFNINPTGNFLSSALFPENNNPPVESMGVCLTQPMIANNAYNLTFDLAVEVAPNDNIEYVIGGISSCGDLNSLVGTDFCNPAIDVEILATINISSLAPSWNNMISTIVPTMDIEAIFFYRSCNSNPPYLQNPEIIMDNFVMNEVPFIPIIEIVDNGLSCTSSFQLSVNQIPTSSYQWYLNEMPLLGETNNTLNNVASNGNYHVYVTHADGSCQMVGPYFYGDSDYIINETLAICANEPYFFGGEYLDSSGAYIQTIPVVGGCDTIIFLDLMVNKISQFSFSETICIGETYSFSGTSLNQTGVYIDTLTNAIGCDSIITLDLVISPNVNSDLQLTICENETFTFGGEIINSSGIYVDTLTNLLGCDSIVTLNLTVNNAFQTSVQETICEGETYFFNGENLNVAGQYWDTLTTNYGCDSLIFIDLTIHPVAQSSFQETICDNEFFFFNGQNLNTTGVYFDTLQTSNGCDSLLTLNLTVNNSASFSFTEEICENENFNFNGTLLTTAGTYSDTLIATNGCDSFIILNLTILSPTPFFFSENICDNDTYFFAGENLNTSGIYVDTLQTQNGCDSIVTLDLTVQNFIQNSFDQEICQGDNFVFNGQVISSSGIYMDTLSTANSCDSIAILNLTVNVPAYFSFAQAICENENFDFNGVSINTAGIYSDTLISHHGCDSIITLDLSILPPTQSSFSQSICENDTYFFAGENLNTTGIYADTLININGCDSIVLLNLTVNNAEYFSFAQEICENITFNFNGTFLNTAGTYFDTLASVNGCDSFITLDLSILPPSQFSFSENICENNTYFFAGENLNATGIYVDTLINVNGCDSIVMLNLTVLENVEVNITEELCDGESYIFGNQDITTNGTYEQMFASSNGCDSIVILNINFLAPIEGNILYLNQLLGTSYVFHGTSYSSTGLYETVLTAVNGCDSIAYLDLSFNDPCAQGFQVSVEMENPSCETANNGWIEIFPKNGNPPFTYSIDGGNNFNSNNLLINLSAGIYNIIVADNFGCQNNLEIVLENEFADLFIDLLPDTIIEIGQSVQLFVQDSNFSPSEYLWSSSSTINCLSCAEIQVIPNTTDFYFLTATDENGCEANSQIFIEVKEKQGIYIPNAFSPNGDDANDFFKVEANSEALPSIQNMKIFNRWGEVIFNQNHDGSLDIPRWDGTFNGKNAETGVYIYTVTWKNSQGRVEVLSGDVTLVR